MLGRNTSTLPTPAITPSTRRSLNQPSFIKFATKSPNCPTSQSIQFIG
ncbi:unknown [Alistipes sp. CAG:514]|nr:unknown [Alistipes sp. CAG:514]